MRLSVRDEQLSTTEIAELATAFREGSNAAGWQLVESVLGIIKREARRWPMCDVDDMTSELFLKVFDSLKRFDPAKSKLSTFTTLVVRRKAPRIAQRLSGGATCMMVDVIRDDRGYDAIEQRYAELQEAMPLADLSSMQIEALKLWANGMPLTRILKRLRLSYPAELRGARLNTKYIGQLLTDAVSKLRIVLEVEPQPLESATSEELTRAIHRMATDKPHRSPESIIASLRSLGAHMSQAAFYKAVNKLRLNTRAQREAARSNQRGGMVPC